MACIKWSQPILTSFGWNVIPAGHFPQRSLKGNPKMDPSFSPLPNHTLWIPWIVAHLPCIGWVQVVVPWPFVHALLHLNLFLSGLHTISTTLTLSGFAVRTSWCLSFVVWRMRELLGSYFLPFIPFWARYYSSESLHLHSRLSPCFLLYGHGPFGH